MMGTSFTRRLAIGLATALLLSAVADVEAAKKDRKKRQKPAEEDPFAEYVWPPPPDEPRIKLESILTSRTDVEAESSFRKTLIGLSNPSRYDRLLKPWGVAIDERERILVTDVQLGAVIRFDRDERRMDVFGTTGAVKLRMPMGLSVGPEGWIYVADAANQRVIVFDPEGSVERAYGEPGELLNPTDAVVAPDGKRLFVADSKAHQIKVFDLEEGSLVSSFGSLGNGPGQFNHPTSLAFDAEGRVLVVDQINARVQVLDQSGEPLDAFGGLGTGFGNFARPKDIAVDEVGFIYVTDVAFNNLQLFDFDFTLLTFVGSGGGRPGQFLGAAGVAVRGDLFAVADQQGRRVQLFRFLVPKDEG